MNVVVVIMDSLRKDHVGAYGNSWIQTPNIDALAKESLRFTQALPESIPTINARRAIHTGTRTWPFKDWVVPKGEDIILQGWQPIPRGQTTLAEILKKNGFRTMLVTDTMHHFKPSYNMQRGFDAFDFIRGQTTDNYAPNWTYPLTRSSRPCQGQRAGHAGPDAPVLGQRRRNRGTQAGERGGLVLPEGVLQGLQDLSVFFGGGQPDDPRDHFTLGYNDHAWVRDEKHVMFAKNDGSNPLLFDVSEDPNMDRDIARKRPDVVKEMWNDYVLADAGGPLPRY